MKNVGVYVVWIAFGAVNVCAQPPAGEIRDEIKQVREQIRLMEQRLAALEARLPADSTAVSQPLTSVSPPVAADPDPSPRSRQEDASPVDISGFLASRWIQTGGTSPNRDASMYQTHTASLFLGKKIGRWAFHSEMEYDYHPELIHGFLPAGPSTGEVELETAWLNYQQNDWLNVRAGLLMLPTYWRLHSYASTTMTVQSPLLYECIFPPNIAGVMIHGSKFSEEAGITYSVYAGQGREFLSAATSRRAFGGSALLHLPTRRSFQTLDVGFHTYRDRLQAGDRTVWGLESRVQKDRIGFLAEFAHGRIVADARRTLTRGYYLQPSWRIAGQFFGVYRYDQLNDSAGMATRRHTAGLLFRPLPMVALKYELNRYHADSLGGGRFGMGAGVSFFFQ